VLCTLCACDRVVSWHVYVWPVQSRETVIYT
jgi:hypothetical protein